MSSVPAAGRLAGPCEAATRPPPPSVETWELSPADGTAEGDRGGARGRQGAVRRIPELRWAVRRGRGYRWCCGPTDAAKERFEFLGALAQQRSFLSPDVAGISDEQARAAHDGERPVPRGLIKHVAVSEHSWTDFIVHGPSAPGPPIRPPWQSHEASFTHASRRHPGGRPRSL